MFLGIFMVMMTVVSTVQASQIKELQSPSIKVVVSEQRLYLFDGARVIKTYPVSTSKNGTGNQEGSYQTPLGRHVIVKKIGKNARLNTIFIDRKDTGRVAEIDFSQKGASGDLITSRILWLGGLEPGLNRGSGIDSYKRFIYIHGTANEGLIGQPASNGCVRMKNEDVAELFDLVNEKTPVLIVES